MNMMNMWYAWMNVCLLPLCICRILHLSMFYVLRFIFQHYMHVHVHGAIFPEVFVCLVASSSLVRGSGKLHTCSYKTLLHFYNCSVSQNYSSLSIGCNTSRSTSYNFSKQQIYGSQCTFLSSLFCRNNNSSQSWTWTFVQFIAYAQVDSVSH